MFPGARGIMRYHWFGDGNLSKYNPHLNVMIEALEYVEDLERLKKDYKRFLERITRISLGDKKIDIYYQYYTPKTLGEKAFRAKRMHVLRYVTRATFLLPPETNEDLRELAEALKGFRNTTVF